MGQYCTYCIHKEFFINLYKRNYRFPFDTITVMKREEVFQLEDRPRKGGKVVSSVYSSLHYHEGSSGLDRGHDSFC